MGLEQMTEVQAAAIPVALQYRDIMVSARTGSGKTLAFLLPTLQRLLSKPIKEDGVRALILAPTRELARQITKQCKRLCEFSELSHTIIIGGEDPKHQVTAFRRNPDIVIATPGRLLEHVQRHAVDLSHLQVLVIDEADRMLEMGFSDDVLKITATCNKQRQTMLFSASLNHHLFRRMIEAVLNQPQSITLQSIREQHSNIVQQIILADDYGHKDQLLSWLLQHEQFAKALVFTNTKLQCDRVTQVLQQQHIRSAALHGDMEQKQRNQIMTLLRDGKINVLVATDIAARGIDIEGIDLVINYNMARNGQDYAHRIGRTGRVDNQGLAIALIDSQEWNLMISIEHFLGLKFERRKIENLEARYQGPKKQKASGKAVGKKKDKDTGTKKQTKPKVKKRLRDQKNIGKRRIPKQHKDND
ncbi:MAG: DEAD/DEAH box helicase [Gammaproteobacteria bacterium]|nr:MAG: DEAD/DEAH box helicase [Gammaproteobacteria bacterium]